MNSPEGRPDFQALKRSLSIETYLGHIGALQKLHKQGNKWVGPSPFRPESEGRNSFQLDTTKGVGGAWFDHGCRVGGGLLEIAAAIKHGAGFFMLTEKEQRASLVTVAKELEAMVGLSSLSPIQSKPVPPQIHFLKEQTATQIAQTTTETPPALPEAKPPEPFKGFIPLDFELKSVSTNHEGFEQWAASRGFSTQDLVPFSTGIFTGNRGLMVGRVVFPLRWQFADGWKTIGYSGRAVNDEIAAQGGKWNLPKNFPKSHFLYGLNHLLEEPINAGYPIFLVEGILDVVAVARAGHQAVAIMGSSASVHQVELLKALVPRVHVLLDGENPEGANETARLLVTHGIETKIVRLPENHDPASLLKEELQALLGNST